MQEDQPAGTASPSSEAPGADELAAYARDGFDTSGLTGEVVLPLADEPFVECWEDWRRRAGEEGGVLEVLRGALPQLSFPIEEGISQSDDYRAATLRGVSPTELDGATGLRLERPDGLELVLHPSAAGRIPVLLVRHRKDFVALARALAHRNEPHPIPRAQGALMVGGFNNWVRLRAYRRAWAEERDEATAEDWAAEMRSLRDRRHVYQDRFIVVSDGPYSGVPAGDLGLDEAVWRERSLELRREHETTHYLTRRLLGTMRNHLLDELMADYAGLTAAFGRFEPGYFLRFMGVEQEGRFRSEGRLGVYRGNPPLSEAAFSGLARLARRAARELAACEEQLDRRGEPHGLRRRTLMVLALARTGLLETANPGGADRLAGAYVDLGRRVTWRPPPKAETREG